MKDFEVRYLPIYLIKNKEVLTKEEKTEHEIEEPMQEKIEWV